IKVMNLVSLLIAPAVVAMSPLSTTPTAVRYVIAGIAVVIIIVMVTISTRREVAIASSDDQPAPKELGSDATREDTAEHTREETVEVPMEQSDTKVDKLA